MGFSYDRLGYAKSSHYSQAGGGFTLSTQAHRAMLHDVVIFGHSAGGWSERRFSSVVSYLWDGSIVR